MTMRVSTRAIMGNYNRNLNKAIFNLDTSRNKVLTNRRFNSIAEDPSGASHSFKLWREFGRATQQLENVENTQALFDNVSEAALQVSDVLSNDVTEDVLRAINGATSSETRKTYAKTLRGMQETIVLSMNGKYADRYLFGGGKTEEAPFKLENGKLTFRGVDVNPQREVRNPRYNPDQPKGPNNQPMIPNPNYEDEYAELKKMADETMFIDFGFGIETGAKIDGSSAFDTSVSGLNVLGYGQDENGMPNNVVVLLGQMADALEQDELDTKAFGDMTDKFIEAKNYTADFVADLGTRSEFLENTKTKLTSTVDTINKQIISVEDADMPGAISMYVYQQYAYNAALKVGQSILSQSFIDFMR